MGLERRLSTRTSPPAPASLDTVLAVSSVDLGRDKSQSTTPTASPRACESPEVLEAESSITNTPSSSMPPPPRPSSSETFETRSHRSTSSASRNANRLSLTLPIAAPNSISSRPTPTPTSSMPPTPSENVTHFNSPVDSDELIVAIAAQERRVLELREELTRAETELKKLQRQWTISEACKKRPPTTVEPLRTLAPAAYLRDGREVAPAAKRNSELERRKAILLAQSQGTPQRHRRTVFRGGHTRTLSLLSPTKSVGDVSSILEDQESICSSDSIMSPPPTNLRFPANKRATWAPQQSASQSNGVKQLANDFKQGLWTFVEDLRQATVGDEAISETRNRTSLDGLRPLKTDGDQDTIRASTSSRGRIPFHTGLDSPSDTPSKASGTLNDSLQHRRTTSKPENRARKHFSWTPLTFENFDEEDWSNWDSPNAKTSRWSGSTANGDIAAAAPESAGEIETPLKHRISRGDLKASSPKTPSALEELPGAILNRLTPSKIKATTTNFIREWEKSLSPQPRSETFDDEFQDFARNTQ